MPRFYFHLRIDGTRVLDEDGSEHVDLGTAIVDARRQARDLLGHEVRETGVLDLSRAIEIEDEERHIRHRLLMADTITIVGTVIPPS